MCNSWCISFAEQVKGFVGFDRDFLEVGSRDVNGSCRSVFAAHTKSYVGVDIFPGPGVDLVQDVAHLTQAFGRERFDVVVSTEMLEHCEDWQGAVYQMLSVLRAGGVLLLTTRSPGFELHDYPADYWRFSKVDFREIFEPVGEVLELDSDMTLGWACGIGIALRKHAEPEVLTAWYESIKSRPTYSMLDEPALDQPSASRVIFDQYSRYRACAHLVRQCGLESGETMLDIGSGPECLFGRFVPEAKITYVDPLIPAADETHIPGNINSHALDGKCFDYVTAVDVLEHVPAAARTGFVSSLAARARKAVVIGFPHSDDQVPLLTDLALDDQYRKVYQSDYSWLFEHSHYGLPSCSQVQAQLEGLGWHCQIVGHGHAPGLRRALGLTICALEVPGFNDIILDLSEQFNERIFSADFTAPYYRSFIIATRAPVAIPRMPQLDLSQVNPYGEFVGAFHREFLVSGLKRIKHQEQEIGSSVERLKMLAIKDDELARLASETQSLLATLQNETDSLKAELDRLQKESQALSENMATTHQDIAKLSHDRDVYIDNIRSMRQTLSWRITAPMRLCKRVYRYGLVADDRNKLVRQLRRVYDRLPTMLRVLAKSAYRRLRGSSASGLFGVTATPLEAICTDRVLPGRQQAGLPDYFIWSVIDWHFRHQRPQQIALALANTGRRVFYISQIFIDHAEPGFTVEKLSGYTEIYQIRLHVRGAPIIYDAVPSAAAEQQIKSGIGQLLAWADCGSTVSVVNHPYWYGIACALPDSRLVYDCMDHHDGFGNNVQELSELEQLLFARSELVITTSTWLNDHVVRKGARTALVRNACDFEHFCLAPAEIYRDAAGRRIIGYYGAIAEWFDIDLVAAVARAFPEELVLLVGADTIGAARQLKGIPNIEFVGEVPYARLPYYLHAFDVCLLPFKVIPLTLATNPVKAYEYLAAGKPLVTVDLPEMSQFDGLVSVAKTEDDFIAAVQQELQMSATGEAAKGRAEFAAQQTWGHRTAEIIEQVEACTPAPKVSVVVVTYNNLELTKACLHSLDEHSQYPNLEIIVVDNRSADGSPEWLQDWVLQGGNRRLVLNDTNKGFAAANNQGLHLATGDYLVMLNNDTYVTPGWVRTMVNHMRSNSRLGLLGPVTNNIGNEARIPIVYQTMEEMIQVSRQYVRSHVGQLYPLRTAAFFCVMLRAEIFALVGDLDEAFGRGFFEDDDYCRRIERAGFEIACADDVFIHHQLSASFSKLRGLERERLFDENRRIYEAKWGAWAPHSYRSGDTPISSADRQQAGEFLEGHCVVCGNSTRFHYMNMMLWRESLNCGHCLTTSRYRSVARGILQALQGLRGIQSASLQALPRSGIEGVRVYDTQPPFYYQTCAYPLPDLLRQTGWIDVSLSQYRPDLPPGALIGPGITNQNLEALTFADASFDIVITSDVMEHVRLDAHAHREIHRVLKPGGVYLFTVPHDRSMPNTLVRVQVDPEDMTKDVHLLEPEYHGDTNSQTGEGVLSYRVYGRDLEVFLDELGFDVSYTRDDMPGEGIMSTELFCCRKRET